MKSDDQDDQLRLEQSRTHLDNLLMAEQDHMFGLRTQTQLEIGYDPKALYDYIQENWPEHHITELTRLLLDLEPCDIVETNSAE